MGLLGIPALNTVITLKSPKATHYFHLEIIEVVREFKVGLSVSYAKLNSTQVQACLDNQPPDDVSMKTFQFMRGNLRCSDSLEMSLARAMNRLWIVNDKNTIDKLSEVTSIRCESRFSPRPLPPWDEFWWELNLGKKQNHIRYGNSTSSSPGGSVNLGVISNWCQATFRAQWYIACVSNDNPQPPPPTNYPNPLTLVNNDRMLVSLGDIPEPARTDFKRTLTTPIVQMDGKDYAEEAAWHDFSDKSWP